MIGRAAAAMLMLASVTCAPEPVLSGPAHPPMWEASRGDTRIIMIGSVHQLPPQLDWQDARVVRAIREADQLWLELAPGDLDQVPALFNRLANDEAVAPLAQRIGPSRALRVEDAASGNGLSASGADDMESWALALVVGAQSASDAGLSRELGVEHVLTRAFAGAGKPVRGLERPIDQLGAFDGLSPAAQDRMLAIAADGLSDGRVRIRRLLHAWASGDADQLAQIADADISRVPGLTHVLVTRRNQAWMQRIERDMTPAMTILIAVGSGHLVGDAGLPAQLAARGYAVRRLLPDPAH